MSQVEKDREFLRKERSFKPSESNISYINTFEKHKFKKQESTIVKKKISNLTTINILFAVHEGFKNMNQRVL
ncbi:hypothetical protein NBO_15g0001 [Nosema bombycis CQ1]|uniref:Uncharacterized protein n=1 Tax=Nosema bombycis (strain CQ1 / CVCC 102059) TaxID=578461 RepID=R0MPJ4_NOSB1|nr:hypothetical protein NBO_15g0001 [Nosema bombycis CQ1]|eukprot:EOB14788.1 hypothetical protein NBO_15g0001 [Nosema bombycis CQ1]